MELEQCCAATFGQSGQRCRPRGLCLLGACSKNGPASDASREPVRARTRRDRDNVWPPKRQWFRAVSLRNVFEVGLRTPQKLSFVRFPGYQRSTTALFCRTTAGSEDPLPNTAAAIKATHGKGSNKTRRFRVWKHETNWWKPPSVLVFPKKDTPT